MRFRSLPSLLGTVFLFVFLRGALAQASFVYIPVKPPHMARGVTVVVHGLNLKPSKMLELAEQLETMNQDVVLVTLTGHDDDEKAFGTVTREVWLNDLSEAFQEASSKAKAVGVPIQFLGFSVGGLLGVDLLAAGKVHFSKMILLAPALQVHARSRLIRVARILGNSFVIPSRSPEDYRAHSGTTVAAYEALFKSLDTMAASNLDLANIPTRVFIDPDDELVSLEKTETFIAKKRLSNWKLSSVDASQSLTEPKYHHLIIDSKSLGEAEWKKLVEQIRSFL